MKNRAFWILIASTIITEFSCNLSTGALPLALSDDGANASQIALAMGGGMFASLLGSIPVGALVDRVGRLATLRVSVIFMALSCFGLAFLHGPLGGGIMMALRGFSMMSYVTAEFAYVTEIVPEARSVSAVSTLGMLANFVFAFAPAAGVELWQHGAGREQFLYAAAATLLGGLPLLAMPSRATIRIRAKARLILMRSVWMPAVAFLIAVALQSGVNWSLAVLTFIHRGVTNGAILFTAMALATFALRYPAGRLAEIYGPRKVAIPVAVAQIAGCIVASHAASTIAVAVAGVLLGIAWAGVVPVGIGLFFAQSGKRTRGAAMGAYNLSFAIGSSAGAMLAAIATKLGHDYAGAILTCAAVCAVVVPWVYFATGRRPARGAQRAAA